MIESDLKNILSFDCSGGACSSAVVVDGEILASRFSIMDRGQADILLPQIRDVLAEAGLKIGQIDALVTTLGPGSFTGLRIGLAAAKGLALGAGKPVMGFTSFEAFLAGFGEINGFRHALVAIDSKRGPAFVQLFDASGMPDGVPTALELSQIRQFVPDGRTVVLGDATSWFVEPTHPELVVGTRNRISAADLGRRAALLGRAGLGRLPLAPIYLRAPDVTLPTGKRQ